MFFSSYFIGEKAEEQIAIAIPTLSQVWSPWKILTTGAARSLSNSRPLHRKMIQVLKALSLSMALDAGIDDFLSQTYAIFLCQNHNNNEFPYIYIYTYTMRRNQ